jgi:hypothetical protein
LSEVLEVEVFDIVNDKNTPINMFQYEIKKRMLDGSGVAYREINIHELAHKCKEWGVAQQLKHNFHISVATHKGSEYSATIAYWSDQLKNESFRASSEPEAVFKACQWILDNKD